VTYDSAVLRAQWKCEVNNHIDGILLHKGVESELPHGLGYVGSMYTEAPSWKHSREGNKLSTESESDKELREYCVLDVAITARVLPHLVDQLALRDQVDVYRNDIRVQHVCRAMHQVGMYVDQNRRLKVEKEMLARRYNLLRQIRDAIGRPNFNPGSVYQVRDILFDTWKLEAPLDDKERLTASDDPSTADIVLRALLTDKSVTKDQRHVIKLLRYYRKVMKVLGTYVVKLRPWDMTIEGDLGWDDEDDWVDKETRERYGLKKRGIVNPRTGRMYPGWSAVPPVTGRLSSSKPINAMNFPYILRGMVTCQPGNVLVGADADQLEIRVAAAHWQIEKYLLAFREGKDPHSMTAFLIFGDAFCKAAGVDPSMFERPGKLVGAAYDEHGTFIGGGEAKSLRSLSKAVHFACLDKDEPVAVRDSRGEVAISALVPGDEIWTWSTMRKRYEPTQVKHVVNQGEKDCVRVTFSWWGGPRKGRCVESVIATRDHRFLLRDGTYRAAEDLQPNDRLMPFRRRVQPGPRPYDAPGGTNHKVVSVEAVGVREVWDIEVDHEDHNFALASGIFVHNSQYMAGVERVHKMIQSAETSNDDGTTDLPYALLPLRRVRQMHEKWLEGAPQYKDGWEREINLWKQQGYLREPVAGRRRDFLDSHGGDEAVNEIVNFSIQCTWGHTRVLTNRGLVRIRELVGHKFMAWTGKKWAEAFAVQKGKAPLYRVMLKSGHTLVCDASHGFKVPGGEAHEWHAAAGKGLTPLRAGQRVALNLVQPLPFSEGLDFDEEEAWALGYWVGNGSRRLGHDALKWCVGVQDRTGRRADGYLVQRLHAFIEKMGWKRWKDQEAQGSVTVTAASSEAASPQQWLEMRCGALYEWTAHTKRVPEVIFRSSLLARRAFLRGFLDADGHLATVPGNRVTINLCQRPLLEDLTEVFRSVGVVVMTLKGPYKADSKGHLAWRLSVNAESCWKELAWGAPGKLRTRAESSPPMWELERVFPALRPTCPSDKTIKSRIKRHLREGKGLNVSPYVLQRMGAEGLYDYDEVVSVEPLNTVEEVYTLSVNDPEHCYVANGFISKNSAAAGWMNKALLEIYEQIPENKWGPGTGIINQCHDHIVVECPESEAKKVAGIIEEAMNGTHPGLPGVEITATADIGPSWDKV